MFYFTVHPWLPIPPTQCLIPQRVSLTQSQSLGPSLRSYVGTELQVSKGFPSLVSPFVSISSKPMEEGTKNLNKNYSSWRFISNSDKKLDRKGTKIICLRQILKSSTHFQSVCPLVLLSQKFGFINKARYCPFTGSCACFRWPYSFISFKKKPPLCSALSPLLSV